MKAIRPWLPSLRDSLLKRLADVDPAALEAMIGASAYALESMIYHAPGTPLPRYAWRFLEGGGVVLEPVDAPPPA